MRVVVRTWHSVKDNSEKGYGNKMFLEGVELPFEVVSRIADWAKSQQINLLTEKYKKPSLSFIESQCQDFLVSMNKLFKELQREGFNSEKQLLAIVFLFSRHGDNPELIDLQVATQFLSELEQESQSA